jgi:hypothetical protein
MKKIILLGLLLVSASASAHHTTGLDKYQAAEQSSGISVTGGSITTPKAGLYLNQSSSRQPNIVTDPVSCIEKWGDACLEADTNTTAPILDLGTISVQEQIVTFENGESVESILDNAGLKPTVEAPTE